MYEYFSKDWNNPDGGKKSVDSAKLARSELETVNIPLHTQYELDDLELVTSIGVGAFGRVEVS